MPCVGIGGVGCSGCCGHFHLRVTQLGIEVLQVGQELGGVHPVVAQVAQVGGVCLQFGDDGALPLCPAQECGNFLLQLSSSVLIKRSRQFSILVSQPSPIAYPSASLTAPSRFTALRYRPR